MLTFLGFAMVMTFMYLIMTKRLSPLIALTMVPIAFAVLAWALSSEFASLGSVKLDALGPMMLDGIRKLAPTGVMLLFAILYFAVMIDTGLFDPAVRWILKLVKGDPLKVAMGTVFLTLVVSLDGDGSTTYMICVAAMFPLYRRLGMNPLIMTCLMLLSSGVMNLTPWGGPTARAASALHVDPADVFVPMIGPMLLAIAWLFFLAYLYGRSERARLGILQIGETEGADVTVSQCAEARRPHLRWFNGLLTLALMAALIVGVLPMPVLFMIAFGIAMTVNYRCLNMQKQRIAAHAGNVLAVVSLIFAAGIFTGILSGTGMVEAMSREVVNFIPPFLGPYMAPITALISLPGTFFISNDAFYFGMLPILAEAGAHYGVEPMAIARASLMGQPVHLLSPLVPSTYLLVSLAGVDLADHQRFTLVPAALCCLVMTVVGMLVLAFPFVG